MQANILRIISLAAVLFVLNFFLPDQKIDKKIAYTRTGEEETLTVEEVIIDEPIIISARSGCVFDVLKNEYLFEKEPQSQMPLASLTKLMTALVSAEHLFPGTLIEISKEAILQEGDHGFNIGQLWKLSTIRDIMLISSSNDAAFAVAESLKNTNEENDKIFVELMNSTAQKLDLKQAYFLNPTGLDVSEGIAGAYGSCHDITKLMQYLLVNHSDILEITRQESYITNGYIFENTNQTLNRLPVFLGGKTGFSDLAGGNLTVIVDKGLHHPIIITVLGSTFEDRFTDIETLHNKFVK